MLCCAAGLSGLAVAVPVVFEFSLRYQGNLHCFRIIPRTCHCSVASPLLVRPPSRISYLATITSRVKSRGATAYSSDLMPYWIGWHIYQNFIVGPLRDVVVVSQLRGWHDYRC